MIITTHKQFPNYKRYEIEYEGRPLVMETGKLAELCNSAVLVSYGETTVWITSRCPWTSMRSSTPSAASPAASCAARASPACPPCWPAA